MTSPLPKWPWQANETNGWVDDADGNQVASVMPTPGTDRRKTSRLIASAPEMADLLRQFIEPCYAGCTDGCCGDMDKYHVMGLTHDTNAWIDGVRAFLARLDGDTP